MTLIKKESGEVAVFDSSKLYNSLEKSGASEQLINDIIHQIGDVIQEGMTTREIYKIAYKMLKKEAGHMAARYNLKKALIQLGPAGYPFEKFFGEMLKAQGYGVEVNLVLKGFCVNHEVDVVAQNDHKRILVECKFHNQQGLKSSVQVPLYFKSRYMDILKETKKNPKKHKPIHEGWLVTNTQFTTDAIQYGHCAGINMISWGHPKKGSIKERISLAGVYPITCLTTLTMHEKKQLIADQLILCKQLMDKPQALNQLHLSSSRINKVLDECRELCASAS